MSCEALCLKALEHELDVPAVLVLCRLHAAGNRQADRATLGDSLPAHIFNRRLRDLLKRKLIEKVFNHHDDGRIVHYELTAKGLSYIKPIADLTTGQS